MEVTCIPIPQLRKLRLRGPLYQNVVKPDSDQYPTSFGPKPHTSLSLRIGALGVTKDTVFKPLGISHWLGARLLSVIPRSTPGAWEGTGEQIQVFPATQQQRGRPVQLQGHPTWESGSTEGVSPDLPLHPGAPHRQGLLTPHPLSCVSLHSPHLEKCSG